MPFKAKNNREAVVVCAIHVVKRPSKRSVLVQYNLVSRTPGDLIQYILVSRTPGDLIQYTLVSRTPGDLIQYTLVSRTPGDLIQYILVSRTPGDSGNMFVLTGVTKY